MFEFVSSTEVKVVLSKLMRHVIKFLTDSILSFMGQWGVHKVKGNHRLGAALTTRHDRTTG